MPLRKASAYSKKKEMPYTRVSRVKSKSYIRTVPHDKIIKYIMGNPQRKFLFNVCLVTDEAVQIRDNALEASRMTANRLLESKLGKNNYLFLVNVHPHHILREHKMLTGAGADRMQSGMKLSFGKPMGVAARVRDGERIFSIFVDKQGISLAKEALRRVKAKIPGRKAIVVESIGA
ncbi:MAG: 50S ribosomal protein L16 [Nanoarchaeota archaeon]